MPLVAVEDRAQELGLMPRRGLTGRSNLLIGSGDPPQSSHQRGWPLVGLDNPVRTYFAVRPFAARNDDKGAVWTVLPNQLGQLQDRAVRQRVREHGDVEATPPNSRNGFFEILRGGNLESTVAQHLGSIKSQFPDPTKHQNTVAGCFSPRALSSFQR